jgi:hypothetical protein
VSLNLLGVLGSAKGPWKQGIALVRKKLEIRIRQQRAVTAAQWVEMVMPSEEFQSRRSDWQRNMAAVVTAIAKCAWGPGLTTRTAWAKLMAAADIGRTTLAEALKWLHRHGFLVTQSGGKTARWAVSGHNEAAVYQLTAAGADIAAIDAGLGKEIAEVGPLLCPVVQVVAKPRAREDFPHGDKRRVSPDDTGITAIGVDQTVTSKQDALRWAATLRENTPALAGVPLRRLRFATKALWQGGWTPKDAIGALVVAPDGSLWAAAGGHIRSEVGFALAKLARWAETGRQPDQTVRDRGHQVLTDAAHAATKTANQQAAAGFGGTGTPDYTDARQVVRVTLLHNATMRITRAGGLRPWEVVRIGLERAPGAREVVATLTNQHPSVDLPTPSGRLFVRVDNDDQHSGVLKVDLTAQPEREDNGLGFLRALFRGREG